MPTQPKFPDLGASSAFDLYMKTLMERERQKVRDPLDIYLKGLRLQEMIQRMEEYGKQKEILNKQIEITNDLQKLFEVDSINPNLVRELHFKIGLYGGDNKKAYFENLYSILRYRAQTDIQKSDKPDDIPNYLKVIPEGNKLFNEVKTNFWKERFSSALGGYNLGEANRIFKTYFATDDDTRDDFNKAIENVANYLWTKGISGDKINEKSLEEYSIRVDDETLSAIKSKLKNLEREEKRRKISEERGEQLLKISEGKLGGKKDNEFTIQVETEKGNVNITFMEKNNELVIKSIGKGKTLDLGYFTLSTGMKLSRLVDRKNELEKALREEKDRLPQNQEEITRISKAIKVITDILAKLENIPNVSSKEVGSDTAKKVTPPSVSPYIIKLGNP